MKPQIFEKERSCHNFTNILSKAIAKHYINDFAKSLKFDTLKRTAGEKVDKNIVTEESCPEEENKYEEQTQFDAITTKSILVQQ